MRLVALVAVLGATIVALAVADQNPDALASLVADLGKCEQTLGSLRQLQASAIKGDVLDLQSVKAKIEKANPTIEFDVKSFTLKEKPKAEKTTDQKPKGPTP